MILALAKKILSWKAQALAKTMEHHPGLVNAFMKHATRTADFRKFIESNFGEKTPEELASSSDHANAIIARILSRRVRGARLKKPSRLVQDETGHYLEQEVPVGICRHYGDKKILEKLSKGIGASGFRKLDEVETIVFAEENVRFRDEEGVSRLLWFHFEEAKENVFHLSNLIEVDEQDEFVALLDLPAEPVEAKDDWVQGLAETLGWEVDPA